MNYPPLILRPPEAIYYTGLGRTAFEKYIRPKLKVIPIGERGIGFNRLEVDEVVAHYIDSHTIDSKAPCHASPDWNGMRAPEKAESESSSEEETYKNASRLAREQRRRPSITK